MVGGSGGVKQKPVVEQEEEPNYVANTHTTTICHELWDDNRAVALAHASPTPAAVP